MVEMLFNCFFVDYLVNGEVFVNIVQEGQYIYIVELVIVVCCDSRVFFIVEIEEWGNLFMDFVYLFLNSFFGVQFTFGSFEVWVVNQICCVVYQCNWFVVCLLEVFQV